jgi:chromate reductase
MTTPVHVLGFSDSLRKYSNNSGLLHAAGQVLRDGMTLELFDLSVIPLYNGDIEATGLPEGVKAAADALLIATPEYNYSMPGVLKNALDWASKPSKESPFIGKPLAIMGAGWMMGTVRAQIALRQVAGFSNMLPLNRPEVLVIRAWEKFDGEGNLKDEATLAQISDLLKALDAWTRHLRLPAAAPSRSINKKAPVAYHLPGLFIYQSNMLLLYRLFTG